MDSDIVSGTVVGVLCRDSMICFLLEALIESRLNNTPPTSSSGDWDWDFSDNNWSR